MAEDRDTLQQFGASFQTKVLRTLLLDSRLLDSLNDIIDKKFFDSDACKWIIEEIQSYYTLYRKTPSMDVFKVATAKIDSAPFKKTVIEQLRQAYQDPTDDDFDYIKEQFREFCINQNWKNVIYKSVDLLKAGQYDKIKDMADGAMKVGVETDLGMDYVSDYDERTSDEKRDTVPTGWKPIDDLMDGGLGPGELGVIVGSAGSGKCVGGDTNIDIEYEEIGLEITPDLISWLKPWDNIRLDNGVTITAAEAARIIDAAGIGKPM